MRKMIYSEEAPRAIGPYSQAVQTGNLLFTSGQVPIDPKTGKLITEGIQPQVRRVMENLKAVLGAAGTDFSRVIKTTVYLDDMKDFVPFNEVYSEYFPSEPPARSTFQVAALPLGAKVEIEMIALVED